MSSPYDESLLATAPKATKAQLQDGYNPELLAEKTSTSSGADPAGANLRSTTTPEEPAGLPRNEKKSLPFYRTKKGIIIIVVVVVVVIAAVVGGAVGGTKNKKSTTSLPPITGIGASSSSTPPAQGVGSTSTPSQGFGSSPSSDTAVISVTQPSSPTETAPSGPGR